ncbi:phage portal protein [Crossiella sp. SN42]|uniref:phage portal protein n=1 Tax=Crossiella sp. SN42 TaxID=2944808 RepID=UPI00207CC1E5|nr:phage portal protein [Crossiella sp. SN42]MCO1575355.1 phage portal protein [Crossiella sp. SN42]
MTGELSIWGWFSELGERLRQRRPLVERWRRYHEGDHDLPAGPNQHREAFRVFQAKARTNLCGLAVESMVHRMQVIGYRDGTPTGGSDSAVWQLWQAARLDGRQSAVYRRALSVGAAYVVVGPDPRRPGGTRVSIERPDTMIVATDPADARVRLAALRLWHDRWSRRWLATLYLPGRRFHWVSRAEHREAGTLEQLAFTPAAWQDRADPAPSPEMVPVVEFANADENDPPTAEFTGAIDIQDRLNLTVLNRLTSDRNGAFRQRYALNLDLEEDPVTGLPISPFNVGIDQVWTVAPPAPGQPETRLGDFAQSDTSGLLRGCEADMHAFAAVTMTPIYYLPLGLVNISADTITALDAGHVAKCQARMTRWGEDWEEVLELCAQAAGIDRELSAAEIVWARPEALNPAQVADYAVKLRSAGYPLPVVAERIGDTPQQIDRLRTELAADALRTSLSTPLTPPAPSAPSPAETAPEAPSSGPVR